MIKKLLIFLMSLFFMLSIFAESLEGINDTNKQSYQYKQLFLPTNWIDHIKHDYINFYTPPNLYYFLGAVGTGAILANTSADQSVANYYQDHWRTQTTDNISKVAKVFGNKAFAFTYIGAIGLNVLLPQYETTGVIGQWGTNNIRAIMIGAPIVGVFQATFGGDRPNGVDPSSHWSFVEEGRAMSGHAFAGSIPFVTAAMMTENKPLKVSLYAASTLTGLSRINDNVHYLSQVVMGWMTGYLSAKAVMDTNNDETNTLYVYPMAVNDGVGIGVSKTF